MAILDNVDKIKVAHKMAKLPQEDRRSNVIFADASGNDKKGRYTIKRALSLARNVPYRLTVHSVYMCGTDLRTLKKKK